MKMKLVGQLCSVWILASMQKNYCIIWLSLFIYLFVWVYNGNWTEWSAIWSEIIHVISKSNERAAQVQFEITSMI